MEKNVARLGGLGGNVGSDEWNEKNERRMKMKEFGAVNGLVNKMIYQKAMSKDRRNDIDMNRSDGSECLNQSSKYTFCSGDNGIYTMKERRMSSNLQNHGA